MVIFNSWTTLSAVLTTEKFEFENIEFFRFLINPGFFKLNYVFNTYCYLFIYEDS